MPATPSLLNRSLRLNLVVAAEEALPVDATLTFTSADPYAVTAVFHADSEDPVRWTFGRDLLAGGLERACGEGDVTVWPAESMEGPVLCMALRAPQGHALLEAMCADVADFVAETYSLVPPGRESQHLDLEDTFARLLAD
jgi:hypothetical protein